MHKPFKSHLKIALKVLKYLKCSPVKGVYIVRCPKASLETYVDDDWAKGRMEEERINHLKQDQGMLVIKICVLERKKEERKLDLRKFVAREIYRGKREDVGLDELGEGGKEVVSKIGEFGGYLGHKLLGDRGGEEDERWFIVIGVVGGVLFGGGEGGDDGRL
nr:ribonuclease H-like domain-containing protein [Tanacetum cinerariifolium]